MAVMDNLTKAADMKRIREIDFVQQFTHNSLAKLIEVLGVTRKIPMMEGTTMYYYTMSGELQNGAVAEGEVIPLSKIEQTKTAFGEITNRCRAAAHLTSNVHPAAGKRSPRCPARRRAPPVRYSPGSGQYMPDPSPERKRCSATISADSWKS